MEKINLQDSQVIFNPRAEADDFENRNASCSFCNSYVPAVTKLPEDICVLDWDSDELSSQVDYKNVFICASCLNILVKKLEAEMVENMKTRKATPYCSESVRVGAGAIVIDDPFEPVTKSDSEIKKILDSFFEPRPPKDRLL